MSGHVQPTSLVPDVARCCPAAASGHSCHRQVWGRYSSGGAARHAGRPQTAAEAAQTAGTSRCGPVTSGASLFTEPLWPPPADRRGLQQSYALSGNAASVSERAGSGAPPPVAARRGTSEPRSAVPLAAETASGAGQTADGARLLVRPLD